MAKLIVISWRDVPSQVVVRQGRETVRVQLSARFQEAVDRAAMRAGKGSSDAYIADWKRSEPRECGNDLKAEAIAEVARLEACYSDADLERLIRAKGVAAEPAVPTAGTGGGSLMRAMRHWSVRHARGLETCYGLFERAADRARSAVEARSVTSASNDPWPPWSGPSRDSCSTAGCAGNACWVRPACPAR